VQNPFAKTVKRYSRSRDIRVLKRSCQSFYFNCRVWLSSAPPTKEEAVKTAKRSCGTFSPTGNFSEIGRLAVQEWIKMVRMTAQNNPIIEIISFEGRQSIKAESANVKKRTLQAWP
jgi:hypothetical protein